MTVFLVKINRSRPRHPQTNGRVERLNGTIQDMLYPSSTDIGKQFEKLEDMILHTQMIYKYL